jgi:hypothetical protein
MAGVSDRCQEVPSRPSTSGDQQGVLLYAYLGNPPKLQDHDYHMTLQDNLEMLVHLMSRKWGPRVLWVARGRWCNVLHFLGALLVLAFSVIWDQVSPAVSPGASRSEAGVRGNLSAACLVINLQQLLGLISIWLPWIKVVHVPRTPCLPAVCCMHGP